MPSFSNFSKSIPASYKSLIDSGWCYSLFNSNLRLNYQVSVPGGLSPVFLAKAIPA